MSWRRANLIASSYEKDFENGCHLHRYGGFRFVDGRRRNRLHRNDPGTGVQGPPGPTGMTGATGAQGADAVAPTVSKSSTYDSTTTSNNGAMPSSSSSTTTEKSSSSY